MSGRVLCFPLPLHPYNGTIHVSGNQTDGFDVGHESASGNSWGSFSRHSTGQEAITAAYALNRDTYFGGCNVAICEAALQDRAADRTPSYPREDF